MSRPGWAEGVQPVAVIGMAGRFPGAAGVPELWRNLRAGVESITRFSAEEMLAHGADPAAVADPRFVPAEGVLDDISGFDAELFGCPPREAELMDPQHRLCLEAAWQVFETAGYDPGAVAGPVGVFLSASPSSYLINNLLPCRDLTELVGGFSLLIHNDKDFLPTTVSHKLDLRGPSLAVGTACSSSLVAVHLACQSLRGLESDLALAGGVSLQVPQPKGYRYTEDGIYSPDGHCRAFDAEAAGTVGGSGVGVVLLKRWEDAVRDGDHVHAVLLGSAVNNDGAVKQSYTAPGVEGQTAVIAEAQEVAGVRADQIGYVEAHGTGTRLGDAVELAALTRAFRRTSRRTGYCAVGSLKTNLGHLDAAAGVAALIKTVLTVEHGEIPASLHYRRPNPDADPAATPFYINAETRPWPGEPPRTAGVSAFGIGGTNAHLVVQQAPPVPAAGSGSRPVHPLVLSARDAPALARAGRELADHLRDRPELALPGVALTLGARRAFPHRRVVLATDLAAAVAALAEPLVAGEPEPPVVGGAVLGPAGVWHSGSRPVVLVLPGAGMGLAVPQLYREEPAFRARLDECVARFVAAGTDLGPMVAGGDYPAGPAGRPAAEFAAGYALAGTLAEWSLEPAALLGHGLGECLAATLAGVFTLDDAVRLVCERARLAAGGPVATGRFLETVGQLARRPPRLRLAATSAGGWVDAEDVRQPGFWARRAVRTRLDGALRSVLAIPDALVLVAGPDTGLARLIQRHPARAPEQPVLAWRPERGSGRPEPGALTVLAARAWAAGGSVGWPAYHARERPRRVPCPPSPVHRRRYWVDPPGPAGDRPPVPAGPARLAALTPLLAARAERAAREQPVRPVDATPGLRADLDRLCAALALSYLGSSGVVTVPGSRHRVDQLRRRLRVLDSFARFLDYLLGILAEDGILRRDGGAVVFQDPGGARPDPVRLAGQATRRHPGFVGLVELLVHCAAGYPQALSVPGAALEVLYPEGRGDLLQRTLGERTVPHTGTGHLVAAVAELARQLAGPVRAAGRVPRVLEVGAGGGRLTWELAAALATGPADYLVTDVGRLFVRHLAGEAGRRGLDFVRAGVLDISRDPAGQGLPGGGFDLVTGLDVVHATADVRTSLAHLRTLLAPGGVLALVETTSADRWQSMIWGLSEGWWGFADDLRERQPLLDRAGWARVVAESGLADPAVLPAPGAMDAALVLGQAPAAPTAAGPAAGHPPEPAGGPPPDGLPPKRPDPADWLYLPGWTRIAAPDPAPAGPGRCLVFTSGPVGDRIAGRLRERGWEVVPVRPGTGFAAAGDGYRMDPAQPEHYRSLLAAVAGSRPVSHAVHAWQADPDPAPVTLETLPGRQLRGLHSLLFLAQAEGSRPDPALRRLLVVSSGAQEVMGGDLFHPEQAMLHSAVKVLAMEYPDLACGAVDLPPQPPEPEQGWLAGRVVDELGAPGPVTVAYRGRHRWRPSFSPLPTVAGRPPRPGGVYLITGGLGGIGLALAGFLGRLPARLVLTGRTGLPAREGWDDLLRDRPDDPRAGAVRRLRELVDAGVELAVHQADVTSLPDMQAVVDHTTARFGPITGVVHAAGVTDHAGMIQRREPADTDAAIAAKVTGTLVLDRVLAGHDLDFFLLCSSLGPILHKLKFGEVGYVAGNEFLTAFAAHRAARGRPGTVAVCWTDWLEAGMWARARDRLGRYELAEPDRPLPVRPSDDLLRGITDAEGVDVFCRVLRRRDQPQLVVSTQDLDALLARHDAFTVAQHRELVDRLRLSPTGSRPDRAAPAVAPRNPIEASIAGIWEALLGVTGVGAQDDFFDLGGDSLLALRFLSRLREEWGVEHPIARMFEASTLQEIAADIAGARGGDGGREEVLL